MNYLLFIIVAAFIIFTGFDYFLDWLNYQYLKKHAYVIPEEFTGNLDEKVLSKTVSYTIEKMRFSFFSSLFENVVMLVFIFGGLLNLYNQWINSFKLPFIFTGVLFFLILKYADEIIGIPFSLYSNFKIENKYEFNKMTFRLWCSDFMKSTIVSTLLILIMASAVFYIIKISPDFWWFWGWLFFFIFSVFMMYLSPYVIEPLFNKFTPLENSELEAEISALLEKAGIKVSRVLKMDASKRTKHSNAYFTGVGRVKRIVLFDTLLSQLGKNEILAVLAHEAGHWKKKHLLKLLVIFETTGLFSFYIAYLILKNNLLYNVFGLSGDKPGAFFAELVLLSFLVSIVSFPCIPVFNFISRKFEYQADKFACDISGGGSALADAMVKLTKDNLANLQPHPFYAKFHYSHPPILERIRFLKKQG